jgi:hypothetical protein
MRAILLPALVLVCLGAGCTGPVSERLLAGVSRPPSSLPVPTSTKDDSVVEQVNEMVETARDIAFEPVMLHGEGVELSADFPRSVDLYPYGKTMLATARENDGVLTSTIILQTDASKASVLAWYEAELMQAGWEVVSQFDADTSEVRAYSHGDEQTVVTALRQVNGDRKTLVTVVYQKPIK